MNENPYQAPADTSDKPKSSFVVTGFQLIAIGLMLTVYQVYLTLYGITVENVDREMMGVVVTIGYAAWLGVSLSSAGLVCVVAGRLRKVLLN